MKHGRRPRVLGSALQGSPHYSLRLCEHRLAHPHCKPSRIASPLTLQAHPHCKPTHIEPEDVVIHEVLHAPRGAYNHVHATPQAVDLQAPRTTLLGVKGVSSWICVPRSDHPAALSTAFQVPDHRVFYC